MQGASGEGHVFRNSLREGRLARSETWLLGTMAPKGDPIEQLALGVERMVNSPGTGDYIREQGMQNPLAMQRQIEALRSDDPRQRWSSVCGNNGSLSGYRS